MSDNHTRAITLNITGMTCGHCAKRVADALTALPGVTATVNQAAGVADIQAPEKVGDAQLIAAVESCGYAATVG